jgi:hypothetical protein
LRGLVLLPFFRAVVVLQTRQTRRSSSPASGEEEIGHRAGLNPA